MKSRNDYTHYGWFGLCPIYMSRTFSECPVVAPRHWTAVPLFVVSQYWFAGLIFVKSWMDPQWVPYWPLRVTGEIE